MSAVSAGLGSWGLMVLAVACNVAAQVLMKTASVRHVTDWHRWLSPHMCGAVGLYGASFVLTALVYSRLPLGTVSPLMAGLVFLGVSACSVLLLGEPFGVAQLLGMVCIVVGIGLLARTA